jgi:hypothetical protein
MMPVMLSEDFNSDGFDDVRRVVVSLLGPDTDSPRTRRGGGATLAGVHVAT